MPSYTIPERLRKAGYSIAHMMVRRMYSLYRNGRWLDDDKDPQNLIAFAEHHHADREARAKKAPCRKMPTKSTQGAPHVDETPVLSAQQERIRSERAVTESARASADSLSDQVVPPVPKSAEDDKEGAGAGAADVRHPSVRPRRLPTKRAKEARFAEQPDHGSEPTAKEDGSTPLRPLQPSEPQPRPPFLAGGINPPRQEAIAAPEPAFTEQARAAAKLALERLPEWQLHDETVQPKLLVQKVDVEDLLGEIEPISSSLTGYGAERVIQVIRRLVAGQPIATFDEIGFNPETAQTIAQLYGHHAERIRGLRPFEVNDYYRLLHAALAGTTVKDLSTPNRQGQKNSLSAGGQYKSRISA